MSLECKRVFIVEDSPVFAKAIGTLLSEIHGTEVIGYTGDACQAIEEIPRLHPDVVILDIQLAGGSGLDVLKALRPNTKAMPVVIVFSSMAGGAYQRACFKAGAHYVLNKSRDYDRLVEIIRALNAPLSADMDAGMTLLLS